MKTVLQTLLPVLFVLVAFSGCTHKGYDEVEDVGEWRSLGHMEREEWYHLGEDYAIDKRRMYLRGERIPWDDNVIEQAKMKRRHQ